MESDLQQCDKDAGIRQFRAILHNRAKQTATGMSLSELSTSTGSIATNRYVTPPTTTKLLGYTNKFKNTIKGKCVTTMYMPLPDVVSQMTGGTLREYNQHTDPFDGQPDEENKEAHQAHLEAVKKEANAKNKAKKIASVVDGTCHWLADNFVPKKVMCAKGTECVAYVAARGHIEFLTASTTQKTCYLCTTGSHTPCKIFRKFDRQCKPGETPRQLYDKCKADRMAGLCVPC